MRLGCAIVAVLVTACAGRDLPPLAVQPMVCLSDCELPPQLSAGAQPAARFVLTNNEDILAAGKRYLPPELIALASQSALLHLRLNAAGEVTEIRVQETSGHIDLDRGITQVLSYARFAPPGEERWIAMPFTVRGSATQPPPGDGQTPRGAVDLPSAFGAVFHEYREGCATVMGDPRIERDQLRLIRSFRRFCDYRVPPNRYGVRQGELLRIEKGTGHAIGIVEE